jgi:hypothetical protein
VAVEEEATMFHNGQLEARSVRPLMAFMLNPLTKGATFKKLKPTFADIREYLLTILWNRGRVLYPNKTSLEKIGTDPTLVRSLTLQMEEHYRQSWFARGTGSDGKPYPIRYNDGYQAPPLDGIWATAPYFHNASVPTLSDVLDSKSRPRTFTRPFRTQKKIYRSSAGRLEGDAA